jgi:hypothetical protein
MNMVNPGVFIQKVEMAAWAAGATAFLLGALVMRLLRNAADGRSWPIAPRSLLGRVFPPIVDLCPVRCSDRRLSTPSRASPSSIASDLSYCRRLWD